MKIGIGIPGTSYTLPSAFLKEYSRRADSAGFSTLTHLDRVVYSNSDPIIALATAAAVTKEIRLQTSVLLAPLRDAALLAKQAATLDSISSGRLTLGLAVGSRRDDYIVSGASHKDRGKRFDQQLALMFKIWSGESPAIGISAIGPEPVQKNGPEILIGGRAPAALRRVAGWATGYITGAVFSPESAKSIYQKVVNYWIESGREGLPRFVGTVACAIGKEQARRTAESIDHYYRYRGPIERTNEVPTNIQESDSRNNIPSSIAEIVEVLKACESIGMDEVIVRPGVAELDQVDKLAELL